MDRVLLATILGLFAGVICTIAGVTLGLQITLAQVIWILLNRTVMGFVIGISGLRLHWALRGSLIGLIVGSIFSYASFLFDRSTVLIVGALVASVVYGFGIDYATTVVFKRPLAAAGSRCV
jgi:hypothetical protein